MEVDLHKVNHEIEIVKGRFVETVGDVYAPQEAISLVGCIFSDVHLHSLYLDKYLYLKIRAILREDLY